MTDKEAIEHAVRVLEEMIRTTDDIIISMTAAVAVQKLKEALVTLDRLNYYIREKAKIQLRWYGSLEVVDGRVVSKNGDISFIE